MGTDLMLVPKESVLQLTPFVKAIWPQNLTPQQVELNARICLAYGYDPLMGEVVILGGKLYVTCPGRLRVAQQNEDYGGFDFEWVGADDDGLRRTMQIGPMDIAAKATVHRTNRRPTVAFGMVRAYEMTAKNQDGRARFPIVASNPQEMAYKRAVERAHRYAYSMPLPSAEEKSEEEAVAERRVDVETGEITGDSAGCTAKQRGKIHAQWADAQLAKEDGHRELMELYGVDSTMKLNVGQASEYIDALQKRLERGYYGSPMKEASAPTPAAEVRDLDANGEDEGPQEAAEMPESTPEEPLDKKQQALITYQELLDEAKRIGVSPEFTMGEAMKQDLNSIRSVGQALNIAIRQAKSKTEKAEL